ncbi:MAG: membrane protein insertase YidC [Mucinivorans sp.]
MNKNTIVGLVLIGLILFGFTWYNNKQLAQQQELRRIEQLREDSLAKAWQAANPQKSSVVTDTLKGGVALKDSLIVVAVDSTALNLAKTGKEEFTTLENKLFKLTFSNKGGRIASVDLKDYKRLIPEFKGDALTLFQKDSSSFGLEFFAPERVNTADLYFEQVRKSDNAIVYRLHGDGDSSFMEFVYTIAPNDYMLDFSVDLSHFKGQLSSNQRDMLLNWNIVSPQEEKGFENENNYTTVAYKYPGEDGVEELSMGKGKESEDIKTKVKWVAFKQQFFSSIIIAKNDFGSASVGFNTFKPSDSNIKDFNASLTLPYDPSTSKYDFNFYFGPNKFATLNSYEGLELQKLVPLGWWIIGWVNRWLVIPTFDFLGRFISNFGIIILLLTIFIKIIISPLTYKSYLSTAKMRLLKPDLDKINAKYPNKSDAMAKQQAMMALYKSAGVSPMGGCLPMLIQFPILIAMFRFFPTSIELRGQSFLWADDLSSFDSILNLPFNIPFYGDHVSLFTLLMAISLFITSKINFSMQPMNNNQMPGMKFMMLYMMPIMMLLIFNNSSSGLSWYYLLSNIITIGQTYAFRYFVDDNKLHARMKAAATKPQKKSKWADRLEQMQKQAAQQQQMQNRRK